LVAIIDGKLVFDRPSRLKDTLDSGFVSDLYTIREWKESVTCHYGTIQIKIEVFGFFNGMI
jgi:hypothetical protein